MPILCLLCFFISVSFKFRTAPKWVSKFYFRYKKFRYANNVVGFRINWTILRPIRAEQTFRKKGFRETGSLNELFQTLFKKCCCCNVHYEQTFKIVLKIIFLDYYTVILFLMISTLLGYNINWRVVLLHEHIENKTFIQHKK